MKTVELDFSQCFSRAQVHAYLKEMFGFPEYYGRNLDALFDLLGDIAEETEIVFLEDEERACCEMAAAGELPAGGDGLGRYLKQVRRVIADAAEKNSYLHL